METNKNIESDPIRDAFLKGIKIENPLNRENNQLPFGLYNPETEGKLTWICGEDGDKKITSVYCFDFGDRKEKSCEYVNYEKAIEMRDQLLQHNWKKLDPPKISFTMKDKTGNDKPLGRKEKRFLAKKLEILTKNSQEGKPQYKK